IPGDFQGHALPGSFLIFLSLWWNSVNILKYICKKHKQTYLQSKAWIRRAELLDGIILTGMVLVAFIMYNHTHGRVVVDIFLHKILALATFLTGLVSFMEVLTKNNITLELMRSSLILLQGTWLWHMGFVLYNPTGGFEWDLTDQHSNMLLTVYFCWHYAFAYIIIGVNYAVITW
ncbi:Transmembrane protein 45A, partial [Lemmus lemmus]